MSRNRAKGTAAEGEVVAALHRAGWPSAERRALYGSKDRGDITGLPSTMIEVKNCARTELGQWVEEARTEAANAGARWWAVWSKRRGKGRAEDWFVVMDGAAFLTLLADAHGLSVRESA